MLWMDLYNAQCVLLCAVWVLCVYVYVMATCDIKIEYSSKHLSHWFLFFSSTFFSMLVFFHPSLHFTSFVSTKHSMRHALVAAFDIKHAYVEFVFLCELKKNSGFQIHILRIVYTEYCTDLWWYVTEMKECNLEEWNELNWTEQNNVKTSTKKQTILFSR